MIRLRVPGSLIYRNLALRVVGTACAMSRASAAPSDGMPKEDEFDAQAVSAVGEAFNNIAIHGYAGGGSGDVDIEVDSDGIEVVIRLMDTGRSFDPSTVPVPDLDELPECGMGLFIMNSFMDEVRYTPGSDGKPNVLCMTKRRPVAVVGSPHEPAAEPARNNGDTPGEAQPSALEGMK
jgi:serine/threonine-protein kinase RsbW